jgi:hypothetical protein
VELFPSAQGEHASLPTPDEYLPASHKEQEDWPEVLKRPPSHGKHSAPFKASENFPGLHREHAPLPISAEYFPASHTEQADWPEGLKRPTSQGVQAAAVRAKENVPASQGVQAVAAVSAFVLDPAPHARHSPVCGSGAYRPFSHIVHSMLARLYSPSLQSTHRERSALESLPVGQSPHSAAPVCTLYLPAGQRVQLVAHGGSTALAKWPTAQGRHEPPAR